MGAGCRVQCVPVARRGWLGTERTSTPWAAEIAAALAAEAIVKAGARSSSAKIPGRLGRVPLETMLGLLFRSGVAARSTQGSAAHRLGPDPVSLRERRAGGQSHSMRPVGTCTEKPSGASGSGTTCPPMACARSWIGLTSSAPARLFVTSR